MQQVYIIYVQYAENVNYASISLNIRGTNLSN